MKVRAASIGASLAAQLGALASSHGRVVVAIDGPGCCGKSTLAQEIARSTGAVILETDDFHLPGGTLPEPGSPLPFRRWSELARALENLAQGSPASFQPIDWESFGLQPVTTIAPRSIVILDGIGALHESLAPRVTYRIWVDGAADSRMQRVIERNGQKVADMWAADYTPAEMAYLRTFKPWRTADLWVLGAGLEASNLHLSFSRLLEQDSVTSG